MERSRGDSETEVWKLCFIDAFEVALLLRAPWRISCDLFRCDFKDKKLNPKAGKLLGSTFVVFALYWIKCRASFFSISHSLKIPTNPWHFVHIVHDAKRNKRRDTPSYQDGESCVVHNKRHPHEERFAHHIQHCDVDKEDAQRQGGEVRKPSPRFVPFGTFGKECE